MALNKKIRRLTAVALISSLSFAGRLVFQFIPNVQPLTSIIIICTLVLGFRFGGSVAIVAMLLSNVLLGFGIWTFAQMASFLAICLLTKFLSASLIKQSISIQAIYAGLCGYLYGFLISFIQAPFLGINRFFIYYLQGLSFDTFHAIGNFCFFIILAPILVPLLKKLKT